ncbi:MAG: preprotein translocase subunit SecG [Rhizobacter sp.]
MQMLLNVVLAVQMLSALVMIGLVLIQHGKGADMGASFGSGSSGSLFGATGSANFLSRSTAVSAAVFFLCTLALVYFAGANRGAPAASDSVLDRATVPAVVASGPVQIPGAVRAPASAPVTAPAVEASAPAPAASTTK